MANHDTISIALKLYLFQPSIDIFHASEFISMSSRCFRWYIHCFIKPWPILCQWPLNYFQVVSFFGIINTALVNIYTYIFECLGEIFHGSGIVRSKDNQKCCTSYSFQQCILSPKLRISNPLNLLQMVEEILLLVSVYIEAKNLCRLTIFISWTKNCQPSRPYPWFIFLLMLFIIFLVDF